MKFCLLCLLLWPLHSFGQEEISFDRLLKLVWEENPTLRSSRATLKAQNERVSAAKGQYYPEINAQLSHSKSEVTKPSESNLGVQDSSSARLELSQNIFAGMATKASVDSSLADQKVTQSEAQMTFAEIGSSFIKSYAELYYAKEAQKLTNEILDRRKNNYELVKLRFEGGNENRGSLLVAKASLDEATFNQDKSNFDLSVARQKLSGLTGLETDLTGPIAAIPMSEIDFSKVSGEEALKEIEDHPNVKSAVARIEKSKAGLTTARSTFFPKLSLSAGLNRNDQYFFPDQNESWNVGLTLTIPLFKGGQNIHNFRASESELASSQAQGVNILYDQKNKITAGAYALKSNIQRVRVSKSSMDAARVRTEIARQKYNNGLLSFDDWSKIEDDYALRQTSHLEAQSALVNAHADWMLALGRNPFEKLSTYTKAMP